MRKATFLAVCGLALIVLAQTNNHWAPLRWSTDAWERAQQHQNEQYIGLLSWRNWTNYTATNKVTLAQSNEVEQARLALARAWGSNDLDMIRSANIYLDAIVHTNTSK